MGVACCVPVGVSLLGVPRLRPGAAESENVRPQRSVQTGSWRRSRERGERQAEGGGAMMRSTSDGAARGRPLPLLTHTTARQPIRALPIPGRPVLPRRAAAPRLSPAVVRRCCRRRSRSRRRRARRDAAAAAAASLDICSQGRTRRSAAAPCWRTPASPAVPAITHFL